MIRHGETLKLHQSFSERLDQKERAPNLVISGLAEEGEADQDKATQLIQKLDGGANVEKVKRIGTERDNGARPLLVTLVDAKKRDGVVEKARSSKELGKASGSVRIATQL
jgi:hypothetical protein